MKMLQLNTGSGFRVWVNICHIVEVRVPRVDFGQGGGAEVVLTTGEPVSVPHSTPAQVVAEIEAALSKP